MAANATSRSDAVEIQWRHLIFYSLPLLIREEGQRRVGGVARE
jgi:hypothetical protein